ncbi:T9SS type A sorting domain-containing protein [Winogradskyella psychrotolerans]|uniref:T9SS type A sorting domain-containing protein n=1 Tax=Winogradskyella psychrotolerans TaxID=1344585 RepID=UPI001C07E124|nr:T9SS type A sorting domain-containing protein [Winogradskyella psychrotolerans]MBU2920035.1 T9SS type A sorting domain-containing protein [Winogradskyella psychrotolerans]
MKQIYILFILFAQVSMAQISIGQISTFTDAGDFEGWNNLNSGFTPVTVADGVLTASGTASLVPGVLPDNLLIIDNILFWGGDYTSVGVGGIRFKARNLSGVDMDLVVFLFDNEQGDNVTSAETTSITIPASATSFETYTISVLPSNLTVAGPKSTSELLMDVFGISIARIDDNGDATESLDFDDIEAISADGLSVDDYSANTSVKVFLDSDILNVITHNTIKTLRIYDVTGKLIYNTSGPKADVSALSSGVYVAVIQDNDNQTRSVKFIK